MKAFVVAISLSLFPIFGLAESVEAFHIGTAENPTIDGQFLTEKQGQQDGIIKDDNSMSIQSRLMPIDFSIHKKSQQLLLTQKTSTDWTESHVARVLEKAAEGGKLSYVLSAAKRYELPASVALIPIIESRYQPHAVSPKGAVGLWQLSQAVATDFDLPIAERSDWRASTEVALKHISKLQAHYGRWDLTWAAYNAGQGRVDKALQQRPEAATVEELNLPQETTHYVQSLLNLQESLANIEVTNA